MITDKYVGYTMLAVGIIILFFTLYEAFMMYGIFMQGNLFAIQAAPTVNVGTQSGNVSESGLASAVLSGLISAFPIGKYFSYLLAIMVLAIFASVGYKFARIGIDIMKTERPVNQR